MDVKPQAQSFAAATQSASVFVGQRERGVEAKEAAAQTGKGMFSLCRPGRAEGRRGR